MHSSNFFFSAWGTLKGPILGPLLFIVDINDLPLRVNAVSEAIFFADDTSVIISTRNFEDIYSVSNLILSHIIK
jgi:hypothetical protein